ncbi:MAG: DUF1016 family protein [Candidatus Delongbacteria bacterium]|nr:DUF1016 family protein [Candidatus Delongbacteria bacterium]
MKEIVNNEEYLSWLTEIKNKIRSVQIKVSFRVNSELINFYWELGKEIVEKQSLSNWGDGLLSVLSKDLSYDFSAMKGFSLTNLKYIRKWYQFFEQGIKSQQAVDQLDKSSSAKPILEKGQQAVDLLTSIPWGHNIAIMINCKVECVQKSGVRNTIEYGWSRSVLIHQIESDLFRREGKAITNFSNTLSLPESDLAEQVIKDPYIFDFLTLTKKHNELELEKNLVDHITKFLLELGAGFAYVGRQLPIRVGKRDFIIDLLFYHLKLHCYVVIELKTIEFEPEHAGKLNFYIKAVDMQYKSRDDKSTIGILLCKSKDKMVAEYSLTDIKKPIGISEYKLTHILPAEFKSELPSVKEIESQLSKSIKYRRTK